MGRISKRARLSGSAKTERNGNILGKQPGARYYRAGIYARLSSGQDPKKNESIQTQIEIAEKYIETWNQGHKDKIEVFGRYTDLGRTGTNFDRDDFKRLMQDIRLGDVNCVVVKDLSRFGRNYLEAGNYIEKIFPFLGVRFIAVADGYDTGEDGNHTRQMASEIKNLVNDMYAKEFSAKRKLSLNQQRVSGSYVGGPPPYGYEAYWEKRLRKLRPDRNTAEIVRMIYEKFVEMQSYQAVADYLNIRRINPPAVYKKCRETYCSEGLPYKGWDKGSVERILKSRTYSGGLVQGRTSITGRKEKERIHKPEEEWIKVENTHEALIDSLLYEQAAQIRYKIQTRMQSHGHPTEGCPIGENVFDRVLYCGVCGRKMTRSSYVQHYVDGRRERKEGYFCRDSCGTKAENCPDSNRISKTELLDVLFVLFQAEFAIHLGKQKNYVARGQLLIRRKETELAQKLHRAEQQIWALTEEESGKYMAYRMGELTQEAYVHYRLWKDKRMQELEKQKTQYEKEVKELQKKGKDYLKAIRALVKLKHQEVLTKELVEALIEKIYVYPGKRVETVFTYSDILTGEEG